MVGPGLKDRVVVTGGSRGIGLAVARAFAGEGARVVVGARDRTDELDTLARTAQVRAVQVDLATPIADVR